MGESFMETAEERRDRVLRLKAEGLNATSVRAETGYAERFIADVFAGKPLRSTHRDHGLTTRAIQANEKSRRERAIKLLSGGMSTNMVAAHLRMDPRQVKKLAEQLVKVGGGVQVQSCAFCGKPGADEICVTCNATRKINRELQKHREEIRAGRRSPGMSRPNTLIEKD